MIDKRSISDQIQKAGSVTELQLLFSSESLSTKDEQLLRAHILIATTVAEMPKERIPESLRNTLYSIDQSSPNMFFFVSPKDIFSSLPYIVAAVAGIIFINGDVVSGWSMMLSAFVLSSAFGFFFYHLFKSKFFTV